MKRESRSPRPAGNSRSIFPDPPGWKPAPRRGEPPPPAPVVGDPGGQRLPAPAAAGARRRRDHCRRGKHQPPLAGDHRHGEHRRCDPRTRSPPSLRACLKNPHPGDHGGPRGASKGQTQRVLGLSPGSLGLCGSRRFPVPSSVPESRPDFWLPGVWPPLKVPWSSPGGHARGSRGRALTAVGECGKMSPR